MARRVLIADPHPAIVRLLERMLDRLGYEPMAPALLCGDRPMPARDRPTPALPRSARPTPALLRSARPTPALLRSADVLLIEPTAPHALALARTARAANPTLAIVGEGAMPPGRFAQERWRLVAAPVGHLAKPFTCAQLDALLQQAFAHRDALRRDGDARGERVGVGV